MPTLSCRLYFTPSPRPQFLFPLVLHGTNGFMSHGTDSEDTEPVPREWPARA